MTLPFTYPTFMPPSNGENVIAVTNHMTSYGDILFCIPVAREYARRHNARVDFWMGGGGVEFCDLMAAQHFVRRVVRDPEHPLHKWHFSGPLDLRHGYSAVYEVGYRSGFSCTIPEYYEQQSGMHGLPVKFDLPEGYEGRPLPEDKFVAMSNKNHDPVAGLKIYREFVRHSPLPVVEVGALGETAAADLGAIDRTGHGFLEMAWVLSKCHAYFGCPNSPYVIACGFPCLKIIVYYRPSPPDENHLVKSPRHLYIPRQYGELLHDSDPEEFFKWAMPELYGLPPRNAAPPPPLRLPEEYCECPGAGYCERYGREMGGSLHAICSGNSGWGEHVARTYRRQWMEQAKQAGYHPPER